MMDCYAGLGLGRPLIMGVVNVTPDSFSDGGETFDHEKAIERGIKQINDGADIIDVGGESTRPGSTPIPLEEEIRRVLPVVIALAKQGIIVSVDTRRAQVMKKAIIGGAKIINDISSLTNESSSIEVVADSGASVVLMHMKGAPCSMQEETNYVDVVSEVNGFIKGRIAACLDAGIAKHRICIDPGIGFSKTTKQNFQLLDHLPVLMDYGCPVMVGISRKFGLHKAPDQRLKESISLALKAVSKGVKILRVHDVAETRSALNEWVSVRNDLKQKFY